jgi:hypothetical protein
VLGARVPSMILARAVEEVLVYVVGVVGEGEHLAVVHVVDADGLQDLGLHEVAVVGLGHDGDGDGALDVVDEAWVGHASDAALGANDGGDALDSHDGADTCLLGDARLFGRDDVHDDAAV